MVPEDSDNLAACFTRMEALYPEVRGSKHNHNDEDSEDITIARLNGDSFQLPYNEHMAINYLKKVIHKKLGIHPNNLCLMHDKKMLQVGNVMSHIYAAKLMKSTSFSWRIVYKLKSTSSELHQVI